MENLDSFFDAVAQASKSGQQAADLETRNIAPVLGVVSNNNDPAGRRRVKVIDPLSPNVESDWLRRIVDRPGYDPPMPAINSTVLFVSVDGDFLNSWYLPIINDTNPPLGKSSAINDLFDEVAGDRNLTTAGHQDERTGKDRIVSVGKTLTLKNDAGASITLSESGDILIADAAGNQISLAGSIAFSTASLTVANKQIATVGAVDTRGDALNSRGW